MNSKTAALVLSTPKEKVFSYLSSIENLPRWATEFCMELKVVDGKHKVATPMGELFFKVISDEKTGVIDFFTGPTEDALGILPLRVLALPGGGSVTTFTMFQSPNMDEENFNAQFQSLLKEMENIKRDVS